MKTDFYYLAITVLLTFLFICTGPIGIVSGFKSDSPTNLGEGSSNQIRVDFFYDPSCGSCQKVLPFIQQYEANSSIVLVNYNNIGNDNSSSTRFTQIQKDLGDAHVHVPFVQIGDQYLTGQDNIIGNLDILIKETKGTVKTSGSTLREYKSVSSISNQSPKGIQFFYDPSCGSCLKVLPFIQDYAKSHPGTQIEFNDISADPVNKGRLEQMKTKYPQEKIYVPVVFIGDTFLQSETNITRSFNSTVESYLNNSPSKGSSGTQGNSDLMKTELPSNSSLNPTTPSPPVTSQDLKGIHFFYNPSCTSCMKVLPYIENYLQNNPDSDIIINDISGNKTGIERFETLRSMFPKETIYAPVVFSGQTILQGEVNITKNLNSTVEAYMKDKLSPGRSLNQGSPGVSLIDGIGEKLHNILRMLTG